MIEKVKSPQLPFTLAEGEVIYIEHSRHPRQQRYIERHYDKLLRIFSRRDLTFCYLPLHAANTLRYYARHYYITGQRGEPKRITLDKNMIVWNIRNLAVSFLLAFTLGVSAQNPIVGPGQYFADPSAHQWERGGRLYVYGSRDESADHYCSHHYDIWSTRDLKTWTLHPDIFDSRGPGDEVSYNDELLYAPDCLRMGDRYHLFYCQDGRNGAEGVAESGSPSGPFHSGSRLLHADEIDPSVFQNDDGTVYLFWGQFSAKMARMAPDLKSIDESSLLDSVITERDHHFHEGIQALKHNGHYYLIYADISTPISGVCPIYLRFHGEEGKELFDVEWFRFE